VSIEIIGRSPRRLERELQRDRPGRTAGGLVALDARAGDDRGLGRETRRDLQLGCEQSPCERSRDLQPLAGR
jgi:hypothetical protein